ncbi:DUF4012 domain-containing protein [uncultured Nocardioides sp.]|uniref:DUF4012 domain-containing protein n=1 Tax=uncultured Nocardioides sp. TaxID=198441 RepID=UPI000C69B3A8|nr:hypothetical protein [Nocardioides sp.]|tara:strand:+ start:1336 stop:3072 length:1737 start_codon:yes stop_codon:yes gene_type:complete
MSRRRVILLSAGTLLVLLVGLGLLVGWRALQVNDSLRQVVSNAETLQTALESGGQEDIDDALSDLQASAGEAADLTSGPIWRLATWIPYVGDDARGVRTAARVVSDLANDGIGPLAETATQLDRLLPRDGRIDTDAVRELQNPVDIAAASLMTASEDLQSEDSSRYIDRFRVKYRELTALVSDAASAMDSAKVAVDLLPEVLGAEDRRNYLLVFQNNAEIRATGGLPGAMSIITTEDGRISLGRQDSANRFGERATPVLPLTKDETAVYTEKLGTFLLDANFTPDWPRAAELIRARWEEVHPERLDGVLTLDTVAVSYLLEVTGPVQVGDYTLSADNVVDTLLNQAYVDFPEPAAQDAFFRLVAKTVFQKIASGEIGKPRELLRALVRAGDEGRVAVHLSDEAEQDTIAARRVAGATRDADGVAQGLDITLLDGTGSKMSYYLDYRTRAAVTSCTYEAARVRVTTTLVSDPPEDPASLPRYITGGTETGTKPGDQLVQVRLLTPSDARIRGFTIRGKKYGPRSLYLEDRQVSTAYLLLEPDQPADVTWIVDVPRRGEIPVRVTPGIEPRDYSSTLRGC